MTAPCPECGAFRAERVTRGPLTVQTAPAAAYWHGKPLDLTARHISMLSLLCSRKEVSHLAMQLASAGPHACPNTPKTQISKLRRNLPREVRIVSIWGEGYQLEIGDAA